MSDLTDTDFPPLEPPPFVTEEGREIERLRDELSKKVGELAAMKQQRDEARRELCLAIALPIIGELNPEAIAVQRGWDCFAQEGGWGVSKPNQLICTAFHNEVVERLQRELAAMKQQRDEARHRLRDACADIARIETRFYDAVTPQQIAERNGWDCFEGGGS